MISREEYDYWRDFVLNTLFKFAKDNSIKLKCDHRLFKNNSYEGYCRAPDEDRENLSRYKIFVRRELGKRQFFTIIHEFGHIVAISKYNDTSELRAWIEAYNILEELLPENIFTDIRFQKYLDIEKTFTINK